MGKELDPRSVGLAVDRWRLEKKFPFLQPPWLTRVQSGVALL